MEEGFRGWVHQEGGFPRWIRMGLEGTLAGTVDQVVMTTLSLGLEVWVRAAEAEAGTRVVEVEADVMQDMEEGVGVGEDMEAPGGMTIVIVTAITTGEMMTVEGEEVNIEAVGVVTAHVGEAVEAVVEVGVVVGDTELSPIYAFLKPPLSFWHFRPYGTIAQWAHLA
jgi:hypothetical protein